MDNKTLEEQRRAREEFIALKKMQSGEIEPPKSEKAPELTGTEKIKNNWYYDKWFIIIGSVMAILLAVTLVQCFTKPKYDLEVVLYSSAPIYSDNAERIGEYLEQFCEDIDGNGEVSILVTNCSYNENGGNEQYARNNTVKLQAVLASNANALLYITDATGYEYLNAIAPDALFEGEPLALGEEFYEYCNEGQYFSIPEGLQISCRTIKDTLISKNKNIDEYYKQSKNILKCLDK